MNNNMILSAVVSIVPLLGIAFVCVLLLQKLYIRIRSRFDAIVNCWFCNQNAKVPYLEANSWTCPHCEQYNGFTKDGDYNREIFQQLDCSSISYGRSDGYDGASDMFTRLTPKNGFCNVCNEAQRLKVEKLAQFEPKNESHFDEELKMYKTQLEEKYRLCATCDRHLNKVLREKKKMVLGSKFLDFIINGAETLQQPHFNHIRYAQQLHWKRRLTRLTLVLAVVNVCCLISVMPALSRKHFTQSFGESLGQFMFIIASHVLAFGRVLYSYTEMLCQHETMQKMTLFLRTIFMMVLYSMGLKLPQLVRINFVSLYIFSCPLVILASAFIYNIIDSFRLTIFTFLLVVWSFLAGGFISDQMWLSQNTLLLLVSIITVIILLTYKEENSPKLHDISVSSFHKIYSEDYLSDEDTMSLLSQQLNSSTASTCSMNGSRSFHRAFAPIQHQRNLDLLRSPLTGSVPSLNTQRQTIQENKFLSNSSFHQPFRADDNQKMRSNYPMSMYNFPTERTMSPCSPALLFASNMELNSHKRPYSTSFGMNDFQPAAATDINFMNSSFMEPRNNRLFGHNSDEHLCIVSNNPTGIVERNTQNVFADNVSMPLYSPLSISSSAVYQHQRYQYPTHRNTPITNLLSPSHFSTNPLGSQCLSGAATSWLSGGYFNSVERPATTATTQSQRFLMEPQQYQHQKQRSSNMTAIDENLSRASSQSSGFESQNGRVFGSETSYGPETIDHNMLPEGNSSSTFKPVAPRSTAVEGWNTPPARKSLHSDSFNLRRINEELPSIRRGDLLKKWKESQTQTTPS